MAYSDDYLRDGKWVEQPPVFCDVEIFGKSAERVATITKGTEVYLKGKLKSQEWTSQDGQKRSKNFIAAYVVRELVSVRREPIEQAPEVDQPSSGEDIPF